MTEVLLPLRRIPVACSSASHPAASIRLFRFCSAGRAPAFDVQIGSTPEVRTRNREVRFAPDTVAKVESCISPNFW